MGGCCGAMKTGQKSLPDKTNAKNSGEGNQGRSNGKEPLLQQAANNESNEATPTEAEARKPVPRLRLQEDEMLIAPVSMSVDEAEPIPVGATDEEPVNESKNFMDLETSMVPFDNVQTDEQLPPEAVKSASSPEPEARVSYEIPVEHVFTGQLGESAQPEVQQIQSFPATAEVPQSIAVQGTVSGHFDVDRSTDFNEVEEEVICKPEQIRNLELTKDLISDVQLPVEIQLQQECDLAPEDNQQNGYTVDSVGHFEGGGFDVPLSVSAELEPQPPHVIAVCPPFVEIPEPLEIAPNPTVAVCPGFIPYEQETTAEQVSLEAEASTFQAPPQELSPSLEPVSQHQLIDLELTSRSEIAHEENADAEFEMPEPPEMAPSSEVIFNEPAGLALGFELNTASAPDADTAAATSLELSHVQKPTEELEASAVETYELVDAPKSELEENPAGEERQEPVELPRQDFVEQGENKPVEEELGQAPPEIVIQEPVAEIKQELDDEEERVSAQIVEQVTAEAVIQASLREEDDATKVAPPAAGTEDALMDDWSILSAQEIQSSDVSVVSAESTEKPPTPETETEAELVRQVPASAQTAAAAAAAAAAVAAAAPAYDDQTASEKLVSFEEQPDDLSKEKEVKQDTEVAVESVEVLAGEPEAQLAKGTSEGEEVLTDREVVAETPHQSDFLGETVVEKELSAEEHAEPASTQEQQFQEPNLEQAGQVQQAEDIDLEPASSDQHLEEPPVKATEQEQTPPELHQEQRQEEPQAADHQQQVDGAPHADHVEQQREEQQQEQEESLHAEEQRIDQDSEPQQLEGINVVQVLATSSGLSDQQPEQFESTEAAEAETGQTVLELVTEAAKQSRAIWWKESGKEAVDADDVPVLEPLQEQARQAREIWWEESAAGSHEQQQQQPEAEEETVTTAAAAAVEGGACPQPIDGGPATEPLEQDQTSTADLPPPPPQPIPSSESQQNGANEEAVETAVPSEVVLEPLPPFPSSDHQAAESVPDGVSELTKEEKDRPVSAADDSPLSSAEDGISSTIPTENGELSSKSSDEASTTLSPEAVEPTASSLASAAAAAAAPQEPIPSQA